MRSKLTVSGTMFSFRAGIRLLSLLCLSSSFPQGEEISEDEDFEDCKPPAFGDLNSPVNEEDIPSGLMRVGPNAKYFVLQGEEMSIREVAKQCEKLHLQPAEIRHIYELMAVESFMMATGNKVTVSLGLSDEKTEGKFIEFDGTPMEFHAFAQGETDNQNNMESCVIVQHNQDNRLVYRDVTCNTMVTPMCMFKPSSRCFISSPLSLAVPPGGFSYIGSGPDRDYYVGLRQVPWEDAYNACESNGKNLKLLEFGSEFKTNEVLYERLQRWLQIHFFHPRSAFWTREKIEIIPQMDVSIDQAIIRFERSGHKVHDLSAWPALEWALGEPNDNSGILKDLCISLELPTDYVADKSVFHIYTQNCLLPLFPICYKDKVKEPGPGPDVNETTTKGPVVAQKYCPLDNIELDLKLAALSYAEMLKLSLISRLQALDSDDFRFKFTQERPWLTNFIDVMFRTARRATQDDLVPDEYSNVVHNLIILYYNAANDRIVEPSEEVAAEIQNQTNFLGECMDKITTLRLKTLGGLPVEFKDKPIVPIRETVEVAKGASHLDMILDSYWYYYLVAIGKCYARAPHSRTQWLYRIHHLFVKHFMNPFHERWVNMDTDDLRVEYGVIFGDMDIDAVFYSLRITALAAFSDSDIYDLYFPRPVYIPTSMIHRSVMNLKILV